jgi:F0F1-type ATP synthase membrane subunit a
MLNLVLADLTSHVTAHNLNLHITNHMLMVLVVAVFMWWLFSHYFKHADSSAPTGVRNFLESIIEFLRVEVFRPALKEHTDRFLPFLWTLFFFILFSNLIGLFPIATVIELITNGRVEHIGGTPTGNLSNTAALAILVFIIIHASGLLQVFRDLVRGTYGHHAAHEEHSANGTVGHEAAADIEHMRGEALPADIPQKFTALGNPTQHYADDEHPSHLSGAHSHGGAGDSHNGGMSPGKAAVLALPLYLWNFAPHPFRPQEGEPAWKWAMDIPMFFVLLLLEILGAFIKPFALAIRLFANMIAGHMVLAALMTLIVASPSILTQMGIAVPVIILSLLIYLLEVLVAFLQAYIFVFLSTLFIASAIAPEH